MIKVNREDLLETLKDKFFNMYYRIPYDYRLGTMWQWMKDFC